MQSFQTKIILSWEIMTKAILANLENNIRCAHMTHSEFMLWIILSYDNTKF